MEWMRSGEGGVEKGAWKVTCEWRRNVKGKVAWKVCEWKGPGMRTDRR
jgi:hypothetical protein